MTFARRASDLELIDLGPPHYSPSEYRDCLTKLGRVGRWLGGDRAGLAAFSRLVPRPSSVLDVGCGGGWFTRRLALQFPDAKVVGLDLSSEAIALADQWLARHPLSNLSFQQSIRADWDAPEDSVDVVTATLVCHHLSDKALVEFLRRAARAARRAVIINDLHRHPLAHTGFTLLAPVLFRNRLMQHDGPLSVRKGFRRGEWIDYLDAAGMPPERRLIEWHWAFRWIVTIQVGS